MTDSWDQIEAAYEAAQEALEAFSSTLKDVKLSHGQAVVEALSLALPMPGELMPHKLPKELQGHEYLVAIVDG